MIRFGSDVKRCWVTFVANPTTLDRQMELVDLTRIRELNAKEEGLGQQKVQERFQEVNAVFFKLYILPVNLT